MDDLEEKLAEYKSAVQMLAASNAQLCEIALAADELAELVHSIVESRANSAWRLNLSKLLLKYKIARGGH